MKVKLSISNDDSIFPWIEYLPSYIPPQRCEDIVALEEHCWWWRNVEEAIREYLTERWKNQPGDDFEQTVQGYLENWRKFELAAYWYEVQLRDHKGKSCDYQYPWSKLSALEQKDLQKRWPPKTNEIFQHGVTSVSWKKLSKFDLRKTVKEASGGIVSDEPNWTDTFMVRMNLNVNDEEVLNKIKEEILDRQRKLKNVPNPKGKPLRFHDPEPGSASFNSMTGEIPPQKVVNPHPYNWGLPELFDIQRRIGSLDESQHSKKTSYMKRFRKRFPK